MKIFLDRKVTLLLLILSCSSCYGLSPMKKINVNLDQAILIVEKHLGGDNGASTQPSLEGPLLFDSWDPDEAKFLFLKGEWSIVVYKSKVECIWIDQFNKLTKLELAVSDDGSISIKDTFYTSLDEQIK